MHGAVLISASRLHTQCALIHSIIWIVPFLTELDKTVLRPLLASLFPANLWRDQLFIFFTRHDRVLWLHDVVLLAAWTVSLRGMFINYVTVIKKEVETNMNLHSAWLQNFLFWFPSSMFFFLCVCVHTGKHIQFKSWRPKTRHCPSRICLHLPARQHPITHHTSYTEGIT